MPYCIVECPVWLRKPLMRQDLSEPRKTCHPQSRTWKRLPNNDAANNVVLLVLHG